MEKTDPKISDSDDARVPSENEKHIEGEQPVDILNIPDPDEGLSEEERKKIVGDDSIALSCVRHVSLILCRTAHCSGNSTFN
jgi:hypothetical protein